MKNIKMIRADEITPYALENHHDKHAGFFSLLESFYEAYKGKSRVQMSKYINVPYYERIYDLIDINLIETDIGYCLFLHIKDMENETEMILELPNIDAETIVEHKTSPSRKYYFECKDWLSVNFECFLDSRYNKNRMNDLYYEKEKGKICFIPKS